MTSEANAVTPRAGAVALESGRQKTLLKTGALQDAICHWPCKLSVHNPVPGEILEARILASTSAGS